MKLSTSRLAVFTLALFCQVGNTQTNDATDVTHKFEKFDYVGQMKDGQPNGYGITIWTAGSAQGANVDGRGRITTTRYTPALTDHMADVSYSTHK